MTDKEIMEGNKSIAAFTGWRLEKWCGFEDEIKIPFYRRYDKDEFIIHPGIFHHPLFNDKWGSLMYAVEAIELIEDPHHGHFGVHIVSNGCTIQSTNFRSYKPVTDPPYYYNEVVAGSKIESTFIAIVQFINWYNTHQK